MCEAVRHSYAVALLFKAVVTNGGRSRD
ncbi:MAG: hypothetical protein QOG73_983, partial [Acetobacteraceae bacterium]|nr:hypothetical protein [Acetobacteraceae bacterium]